MFRVWNKENKKSVEACKKLIRQHEIYNHVEGRDEKETIDDYESQGGHVKLNDMIYITPLCREHNKKEVGDSIKLKAGSVLIEEVDPIIEKE